MEITPKSVESVFASLAKAPPIVWVVLFFLILFMFGAIPIWAMIIGIVGAAFVFKRIEREKEIQSIRAIAATYANSNGPIVVGSVLPEETVQQVHERAERWREMLRQTNNPYAAKILVIEFPYQPVLTPYDQLATGWQQYEAQLAQKRHEENLRWYNGSCPQDLKAQFASYVFPAPKQQEQ